MYTLDVREKNRARLQWHTMFGVGKCVSMENSEAQMLLRTTVEVFEIGRHDKSLPMLAFIAAKDMFKHTTRRKQFVVCKCLCVMKLKNRDTGEPHKRIENTCNKTQSILLQNVKIFVGHIVISG